jgi:hypothetical protein
VTRTHKTTTTTRPQPNRAPGSFPPARARGASPPNRPTAKLDHERNPRPCRGMAERTQLRPPCPAQPRTVTPPARPLSAPRGRARPAATGSGRFPRTSTPSPPEDPPGTRACPRLRWPAMNPSRPSRHPGRGQAGGLGQGWEPGPAAGAPTGSHRRSARRTRHLRGGDQQRRARPAIARDPSASPRLVTCRHSSSPPRNPHPPPAPPGHGPAIIAMVGDRGQPPSGRAAGLTARSRELAGQHAPRRGWRSAHRGGQRRRASGRSWWCCRCGRNLR